MKHCQLLLFVFTALAMTCCQIEAEREWVGVFVDEGVSILFPVQPRMSESVDSSAYGTYTKKDYIYLPSEKYEDDENLLYHFGIDSIPLSYHGTPQQLYDNFVTNEVTILGGRLVSQKTITLNGLPGREVLIDFRGGQYRMKCRLVMQQRKVYSMSVGTLKDNLFNVEINKFLDSFTIIPQ